MKPTFTLLVLLLAAPQIAAQDDPGSFRDASAQAVSEGGTFASRPPGVQQEPARERAYLGVVLGEVPDMLAAHSNVVADNAVMITEVVPDKPADRAGIRPYDILVAVNGKRPVSEESLVDVLRSTKPGATVTLTVVRGGREREVDVVTAGRADAVVRERADFRGMEDMSEEWAAQAERWAEQAEMWEQQAQQWQGQWSEQWKDWAEQQQEYWTEWAEAQKDVWQEYAEGLAEGGYDAEALGKAYDYWSQVRTPLLGQVQGVVQGQVQEHLAEVHEHLAEVMGELHDNEELHAAMKHLGEVQQMLGRMDLSQLGPTVGYFGGQGEAPEVFVTPGVGAGRAGAPRQGQGGVLALPGGRSDRLDKLEERMERIEKMLHEIAQRLD